MAAVAVKDFQGESWLSAVLADWRRTVSNVGQVEVGHLCVAAVSCRGNSDRRFVATFHQQDNVGIVVHLVFEHQPNGGNRWNFRSVWRVDFVAGVATSNVASLLLGSGVWNCSCISEIHAGL